MERLDDPETEAWIAAQEAATRAVLDAVPGRDWLRTAVARSARHERLSAPIRSGPPGREFVWRADAGDEKLKLMLRRDADAPLEAVLDPNAWPSDEVLVFAVPSPDGTLVAFGKARRRHARRADPACSTSRPGGCCPTDRAARATSRWPGVPTRRGSSTRPAPSPARSPRRGGAARAPSTSTGSGRAHRPAGLRRRSGTVVLVLRVGQRVRPLRGPGRVGLRARQRGLAASPG